MNRIKTLTFVDETLIEFKITAQVIDILSVSRN